MILNSARPVNCCVDEIVGRAKGVPGSKREQKHKTSDGGCVVSQVGSPSLHQIITTLFLAEIIRSSPEQRVPSVTGHV